MAIHAITLTVNGARERLNIPSNLTLLQTLRSSGTSLINPSTNPSSIVLSSIKKDRLPFFKLSISEDRILNFNQSLVLFLAKSLKTYSVYFICVISFAVIF